MIKSYPYARPRPHDAAREKDTPHADVFVKTTDRCGIPSRNPQQRGHINRTRRTQWLRSHVWFVVQAETVIYCKIFFLDCSFLFFRQWIFIYLKRFVWIVWLYLCDCWSDPQVAYISTDIYRHDLTRPDFKTKKNKNYTFLSSFVLICSYNYKCIVYF